MFARVPSGARLPPPPPRPTSPSRASRAAPPPGLDCERGCEGTRPRVSNGAHSEVLPSTKSKIGFVEKHRSEASCGLGLGAARAALRRASHGVPARGLTPPDGCRSPRAASLAPSRLTAGEDRGTTRPPSATSALPYYQSKSRWLGPLGAAACPRAPPPRPPPLTGQFAAGDMSPTGGIAGAWRGASAPRRAYPKRESESICQRQQTPCPPQKVEVGPLARLRAERPPQATQKLPTPR